MPSELRIWEARATRKQITEWNDPTRTIVRLSPKEQSEPNYLMPDESIIRFPTQSSTSEIRVFVQELFGELGAAPTATLSETILLRNGEYCGRRFVQDGFSAVWFLEERQIKLFAPDRNLIRVIREIPIVRDRPIPTLRAA